MSRHYWHPVLGVRFFFPYFQVFFLEVLIMAKINVDAQRLLPSLKPVTVMTFFTNRIMSMHYLMLTFLCYTSYFIPVVWLNLCFPNDLDSAVNKVEENIQPNVDGILSMCSSVLLASRQVFSNYHTHQSYECVCNQGSPIIFIFICISIWWCEELIFNHLFWENNLN